MKTLSNEPDEQSQLFQTRNHKNLNNLTSVRAERYAQKTTGRAQQYTIDSAHLSANKAKKKSMSKK